MSAPRPAPWDDADRLDTGDEAIAAFGRLIPPGGNAILAVTDEVTTDPLKQFAAGFGGKVSRRPLDEVLAELEAQDEAAREADKAARKAIAMRDPGAHHRGGPCRCAWAGRHLDSRRNLAVARRWLRG